MKPIEHLSWLLLIALVGGSVAIAISEFCRFAQILQEAGH
jgi:hypothetical protein